MDGFKLMRSLARSARRWLLLRRRLAIGLMAVAASLADERRCDLELFHGLRLVLVVGNDLAEGGEFGFKVAFGFPDFRQCPCFLSGLRRLREQARRLLRRLAPLRERGID